MTIRPVHDNVLIRPDSPEERTEEGVVIPTLSKSPATTGTVLAVGPGRVDDRGVLTPIGVGVGDRVMFEALAGFRTGDEPGDPLLMSEMNIQSVIE